MHLRLALSLISMIGVLTFATQGLAQVTDVLPSQIFDPSIEAAGMGGASIAAFWEENPNDHANPALMGFHSGLRYSYGTTQLVEADYLVTSTATSDTLQSRKSVSAQLAVYPSILTPQ